MQSLCGEFKSLYSTEVHTQWDPSLFSASEPEKSQGPPAEARASSMQALIPLLPTSQPKAGPWPTGCCQADLSSSNPHPVRLDSLGGSSPDVRKTVSPGAGTHGRSWSRRAFVCHGWAGARQEVPPHPISSICTQTGPVCLQHV